MLSLFNKKRLLHPGLGKTDKQRSVEEKHSRSGEEEKKAAYQQ